MTSTSHNKRLLLVEDDAELSALLKEYLENQDFHISVAYDGISAVEKGCHESYDAIILDVQMPGKNGFDVLREIRAVNQTPIIMLTARGEDVDRIVGLELGADDYMPKPCNPRELTARIRAILRRSSQSSDQQLDIHSSHTADSLNVEDITLNTRDRTVFKDNHEIELTSTEFNVLHVILLKAGEVVSKEQLSEQALSRKLSLHDRSTDMHISNLRKKLGNSHNNKQRIKTVRGVGYIYVVNTV